MKKSSSKSHKANLNENIVLFVHLFTIAKNSLKFDKFKNNLSFEKEILEQIFDIC